MVVSLSLSLSLSLSRSYIHTRSCYYSPTMDSPMQRSSSSSSSSGARILELHLRRATDEVEEEEEEEEPVVVWVRAEEWVDLGLVGRAVGLDPATLRFNSYFLSSRRDRVSSSLTWGSLLSFFAARALPCGASPASPIAVQGKSLNPKSPAPASSDDGNQSVSFKRKGELRDDESPVKKIRTAESNSVAAKVSDSRQQSGGEDDGILCMKRRLCLDDDHHPLKMPKTAESCSSGAAAGGRTLFSYSYISEHGKKKHSSEEEMMVSSISHKRV